MKSHRIAKNTGVVVSATGESAFEVTDSVTARALRPVVIHNRWCASSFPRLRESLRPRTLAGFPSRESAIVGPSRIFVGRTPNCGAWYLKPLPGASGRLGGADPIAIACQ